MAKVAAVAWVSRSCSGVRGIRRIQQDGDASYRRRHFPEELQPFGDHADIEVRQPGDVAAWPREAFDETHSDGIGGTRHDNRNDTTRFLGRTGCGGTRHDNDIDLETGKLSRQRGKRFNLSPGMPLLDEDAFAFQVTQLPQPLPKRRKSHSFPLS